jgi:hypothetical protein
LAEKWVSSLTKIELGYKQKGYTEKEHVVALLGPSSENLYKVDE